MLKFQMANICFERDHNMRLSVKFHACIRNANFKSKNKIFKMIGQAVLTSIVWQTGASMLEKSCGVSTVL